MNVLTKFPELQERAKSALAFAVEYELMALVKDDESVPKQTLGTKAEQVGQLLATCFITRKAQATVKIRIIEIMFCVMLGKLKLKHVAGFFVSPNLKFSAG